MSDSMEMRPSPEHTLHRCREKCRDDALSDYASPESCPRQKHGCQKEYIDLHLILSPFFLLQIISAIAVPK